MSDSAPTIPHDRAAEAALVASCVLAVDAVPLVAAIVEPSDFTDATLGMVYAAMLALSDDGKPVDVMTLANALRSAGTWTQLGDDPVGYLETLFRSEPHGAHAEHYARIVADAARARAVAAACEKGLHRLMDGQTWRKSENVDTIASEVDRAAACAKVDDGTLTADLDTIVGQMGTLETETATGIQRFDRRYGGFHAGEYCILAALTSKGKSALASHIAYTVAEARPVLYVTAEMSRKQLLWRMLSQQTGIPIRELQAGKGYEYNRTKVDDIRARLATMPLWIVEGPGATPVFVRSKAMAVRRQRGDLGLIVVDYLQLMHGNGNYRGNREAEVSDISGRLRALALETDCTVLALAQFNRQGNTAGRPYMHQLRESGRLEQDADVVLIWHWDDTEGEGDEDGSRAIAGTLHVDKARNGMSGTHADLTFVRNCTRLFEKLADHTERALGAYLGDWVKEM